MHEIEDSLKQFPVISLKAGEDLMVQGVNTDSLYFLLDGEVSVIKDGYEVAHRSSKGSVYGEMSLMLENAPSATVRCISNSSFYQVDNPKKYLESHPEVIWYIVKVLSMRLSNLNEYLVDMKERYESEDKQHPKTDEERSAGRDKMLSEILQILQVQ